MQDEKTTNLAQELSRTIQQFMKIVKQQGTHHGIKRSEFMLLVTLAQQTVSDSRGMKVSELSAQLQITPAAVTHMINSLEEEGFVERQADPSDRRIVLVKVTVKGQQLVDQLYAEHFQEIKALVEFLGEQDSQEFIRILSIVATYAKERRK